MMNDLPPDLVIGLNTFRLADLQLNGDDPVMRHFDSHGKVPTWRQLSILTLTIVSHRRTVYGALALRGMH